MKKFNFIKVHSKKFLIQGKTVYPNSKISSISKLDIFSEENS